MRNRVAIIDLGTNTFNLLIAVTHKDGSFKKLCKRKISVRLGEGGINKGFITEKAFRRGILTLKRYKKLIKEFKADKVVAFGTSAIRSASNGKEFIAAAKAETGINVRAIPGEREAELIYYGVCAAMKMKDSPSLIMDIGGGSTEFIIANNKRILWKQSFLLGAARMLEKFNPSDPIKKAEMKQIEKYLEKHLQPLFKAMKSFSATELIGSSGSFDSLAEMIAYRFYNIRRLSGKTACELQPEDCEKIYKLILKSTTAERLKVKGLIKMRVDMIVICAIFVNYVFEKLALKKIHLSRYALKEGVLAEMIRTSRL